MDCPDCDGRLIKVGNSYGRITYECKDCGYTEELPDRSIQKKPKIKVWGKEGK